MSDTADAAVLVVGGGPAIPLAFTEPPPAYPWSADYLLLRPDQHVAWRAAGLRASARAYN